MKIYNLYPPFLYIPEESNFYDTWEVFCLKLIKIDLKTNSIERRTPPEQGVDLYYKNKRIAYQCKSNLKDTKFNITNAKKSLVSALQIKDSLPWEKYYLCSNINLTGKEVTKLQKVYGDIEIKGKDYWIGLCKDNPSLVQSDFRTLLDVNEARIISDLNISLYMKNINSKLQKSPIKIRFYTDLHKTLYEITLSKNMLVKEFLELLRCILNFSEVFSEYDGKLKITHYFMYDGVKYFEDSNCSSMLCDIGITDGSIITYWIKYLHTQNNVENNVLQFNESEIDYKKSNLITTKIFERFDRSLEDYI